MRIGIDARAATEVPAGRGRVVRELLRELARRDDPHRYICYAREAWDEPLDDRFEWRLLSGPDGPWHAKVAHDANQRCGVFLATNSYLCPIFNRVATVSIVYDLVTFEPGMGANRVSLVVERLTLGMAVRRSRRLVCISQATATVLAERFPAARARSSIALLGVAPTLSAPAPEELTELPALGFVLAVGTLEPRKNLPRLVAAYGALSPALQAEHPLVVVGAAGWQTGQTLEALGSLGDRCIMLGHISDGALAELYRRCGVFCYPSLGEGFGLPVLEAMAAGAPVITSDVSSLPEVGGDAVEYVDPLSTIAITAGLERVLGSAHRRAELVRRGRERAARFSWAHTADVIVAELEVAALRRPPRHPRRRS